MKNIYHMKKKFLVRMKLNSSLRKLFDLFFVRAITFHVNFYSFECAVFTLKNDIKVEVENV